MTNERCDLICLDAPRAEAIRGRLLDGDAAYGAAERAKALSDPTRLTLAAALREAGGAGQGPHGQGPHGQGLLGQDPVGGELCVCDLAWISERAQNLVSHHMRTLRSHGLVRSRRDGKMVMYSLTGEGLALLGAVLGEAAGDPVRGATSS